MGVEQDIRQRKYYSDCDVLFSTIKETKGVLNEIKDRLPIQAEIIISVLESILTRISELLKRERQLMNLMQSNAIDLGKNINGKNINELKWVEPGLYMPHVASIYKIVIQLRVIPAINDEARSLIKQLDVHLRKLNATYAVDKPDHDEKKKAFNAKEETKAKSYTQIDKLLGVSEKQSQKADHAGINGESENKGGKTMNIEARAEEISKFLGDLFTSIIQDAKFEKVYSDVGTLEDKIGRFKVNFDSNYDEYIRCKDQFDFDKEAYRGQFKRADGNLRMGINKIDILTVQEILPALKSASKKIQENVSNGEIKIDDNAPLEHDIPSVEEDGKGIKEPKGKAGDEPKSAFSSKVDRLNEWIDKASEMGETVGKVKNFYSKYGKYVVKGFKYLIGALVL